MANSDILSKEELARLREEISRFEYIRFSWSDVTGVARGVTVPAREAPQFLHGYPAAAGNIACGPGTDFVSFDIFKSIIENHGVDSCNFVPCLATIYPLPWAPGNRKIGELLCEGVWQDKTPFKEVPRYVARQQLKKLDDLGFQVYSAFESEFHALHKDTLVPVNKRCEFLSFRGLEDHAEFLYSTQEQLYESGITVRSLVSELSPGQFEFTFTPQYGIKTFDDMYIYKQGIKNIGRKHGMIITFMPKPLKECNTSGYHFNISLWTKDGKNAFYDADAEDKLSQTFRHWIGGMLAHFPAMTALCCPTINCYRRLHTLAIPSVPDWGIDNHMVALRVINASPDSTRIENRLPSSACNPYLAATAVLAAGIDGLVNKLEPPARGPAPDREKLPKTLDEALTALEQDAVIKDALGEELVQWLVKVKRECEVTRMKDHDMKKLIPEELEREQEMYLEQM